MRRRKEVAQAARVKAESDYANARTQQEAERAEKAIKEAITNLKVGVAGRQQVLRSKCGLLCYVAPVLLIINSLEAVVSDKRSIGWGKLAL